MKLLSYLDLVSNENQSTSDHMHRRPSVRRGGALAAPLAQTQHVTGSARFIVVLPHFRDRTGRGATSDDRPRGK